VRQIPVLIEGTVAGSALGLLTSIPDSYCTPEANDTNLFYGDCTQPNNLQAQVVASAKDAYLTVVADAEFSISASGYS